MKKNLINKLGFFSIVFASILIRFNQLINKPLWLDEVHTFYFSKISFSDTFWQIGEYWDFAHPPGYYLLMKLWLMFGSTEIWLRLPSIIAFIFCIFLLIKISEKLKFGWTTIVPIIFFCFNPELFMRTTEARMYPIVMLVILYATLQVVKLLKEEKRTNNVLLKLTLALALGFYLDYAILWLIISVFIFGVILRFSNNKLGQNLLKAFIKVVILIIPQLWVLITNFDKVASLNSYKPDFPETDWTSLFSMFLGLWNFPMFGLTIILCVIIATIYKLKNLGGSSFEKNLLIFLLTGVLAPLTIAITYSLTMTNLFHTKNLIQVSIFFIILLSAIFSSLLLKNTSGKVFPVVLTLVYLYASILTISELFSQPKIDWSRVRELASNNCPVIYFGNDHYYQMDRFLIYYSNQPTEIDYELLIINSKKELLNYYENNQIGCSLVFIYPSDDNHLYTGLVEDSSALCGSNKCEFFDLKFL